MHSEHFQISEAVLNDLLKMKSAGLPVIAVGTTVVRVLESLALENYQRHSGWTDIFIYPPYEFRLVDGMLTNFHLPNSTLMMRLSILRENQPAPGLPGSGPRTLPLLQLRRLHADPLNGGTLQLK